MATLVIHKSARHAKEAGSKDQSCTDSQSPTSDSDSEVQGTAPEYGSYRHHVFANPVVAEFWRKKYEAARYEGRHQFDPTFTWAAEEEKRVRRKVLLRIWSLPIDA